MAREALQPSNLRRVVERLAPVVRARAALVDLEFRAWRQRNPGGTFAEFYAFRAERKIGRGAPHKTLGRLAYRQRTGKPRGSVHSSTSFAETGAGVFDDIMSRAGLRHDDVVVDFGCGSLRIGQHFMRRIRPGNYWGLDVTDRFYREGAAAIGQQTIDRFRPNLRVISDAAISEAAEAGPSLVVSVLVLKHIPRQEWPDYFDRLLSLVATPRTRLLLTFTAGERFGRIGHAGWCCPVEDVTAEIEQRRPGARTTTWARNSKEKKQGGHVTREMGLLATWSPDC